MGTIDFILLTFLASTVVICLTFRASRLLRTAVPLVLLGTICVCLFSLFTFSPRLAASSHQKRGKPWSPDFRDGVLTMVEITTPYYPYILVSSLGLAILSCIPHKTPRQQPPLSKD